MSGSIRVITYVIAAVPLLLIYFALTDHNTPLIPIALFFVLLMIGVWLWMRPSHYIVDSTGLTIVWPLRKFHIARAGIVGVRTLDKEQVKKEIGFAVRIGVGGLFGGFGLLWSRKRGMIRFYITRIDSFIFIEQRNGRPFLLSVDRPESMVKDLVSQ